jgi:hypothetical protein
LQPSLVEEEPQADDAHTPRELGVVEVDAAGTIRAEQHPEAEEGDENRQPGSLCYESDHDARREDRAYDQEQKALVHEAILPAG